jgi:hypothetical protein
MGRYLPIKIFKHQKGWSKMKSNYEDYVGRIKHVRKPFTDLPAVQLAIISKQLKLIDILIDQLQNHGLFSSVLVSGRSRYVYRIALSKSKYPNSEIAVLKVNFNRFNMSLHLLDSTGDFHLGTFRFKTDINDDIDETNGTITSQFHYTNDDDADMIEELKMVFYETEKINAETASNYQSTNKSDNIDLNTIKFVDLTKIYCGSIGLATRLSSLIYDGCQISRMTAMEFYKTIDLDILKTLPGIGPKSISIIKNMYVFYDFPKEDK